MPGEVKSFGYGFSAVEPGILMQAVSFQGPQWGLSVIVY